MGKEDELFLDSRAARPRLSDTSVHVHNHFYYLVIHFGLLWSFYITTVKSDASMLVHCGHYGPFIRSRSSIIQASLPQRLPLRPS